MYRKSIHEFIRAHENEILQDVKSLIRIGLCGEK